MVVCVVIKVSSSGGRNTTALCSELDWVWDGGSGSTATRLSCGDRQVNFHSEYSCGTAAVRGSKELADGQHFWEVKMTSPVYGTDMVSLVPPTHTPPFLRLQRRYPWFENGRVSCLAVQMVGIGTSDINLDKYRHSFCSLLGKDCESWGLSYTGTEGRVVARGQL